MRVLAALLLLEATLAGRPTDTTPTDASKQAARGRLDAERGEVERRLALSSRTQQQDCAGQRYATLDTAWEKDGRSRRPILRRATSGRPEASSV